MKATFPLSYCLLVPEALARWLAEGGLMTTPKIQALGVVQEGSPTRWKATSAVEGVGWLEAWGTSLIGAMEALQTMATQRVAEVDRGRWGTPPFAEEYA